MDGTFQLSQELLVGTYRAEEVASRPNQRSRLVELSRLPAARRIHLEGLDRDEVAQRGVGHEFDSDRDGLQRVDDAPIDVDAQLGEL